MNIYTASEAKREGLQAVRGKYDYRYPGDLNLRPGSELHNRLVEEVVVRAKESREVMSRKHDRWEELERTMAVHVDLTKTEEAIKDDNPRKPLPIVIPVGYAMVETHMAFMVKTFLDSSPIFPVEPRGPEDTYGSILLEMLLDWQTKRFRNDLAHYKAMRDAHVYGFGVTTPRWREEWGWESRQPTLADQVAGFLDSSYRPPDEWTLLAEGSEVVNIDPRLYWPDPNVPVDKPQDAEFISWMELTQGMKLLEWEHNSGDLFNCKYLKHMDGKSQILGENGEGITNVAPASSIENVAAYSNPAHVIWMYINLVPKSWGLGESEYPEKWLFGVAGDELLIQARPQGLRHNRFPIAVVAPDTNGRDVTPLSRLELAQGLQSYIDWMMATYMEGARVDVNGRFFIDPSLVNMHDLSDTSRRFIRARRSQFGRGKLAEAVQQFNTSNSTNQNIANAAVMMQFLKETSGAVDNMQGIIKGGSGDRSAAEARGANFGALSKMERAAWMVSRQYMRDMGYLLANQTQQLMSRQQYMRIAGERELQLRQVYGATGNSVAVSPLDLQVQFDVEVQDNTIPSGDYAEAWVQLFSIIGSDPAGLGQMFDLPRIFVHLSRMLGAKNVQNFLRNGGMFAPVVQEDAQVAGDPSLTSVKEAV